MIATTELDLDRRVHEGTFREDLFHQLFVFRIELPPLRRRAGDIPLLARAIAHRLGASGELDAAFVRRLERMPFTGNVRELGNHLARHLAGVDVVASVEPIVGDDLVAGVLELDLPLPRARELVVADFERRYLTRILAQHGGNVTRAAAASGLARRYFQHLRTKLAGTK